MLGAKCYYSFLFSFFLKKYYFNKKEKVCLNVIIDGVLSLGVLCNLASKTMQTLWRDASISDQYQYFVSMTFWEGYYPMINFDRGVLDAFISLLLNSI